MDNHPFPVQVILGTQYAGEMKKGVFSLMNYVLPKVGAPRQLGPQDRASWKGLAATVKARRWR